MARHHAEGTYFGLFLKIPVHSQVSSQTCWVRRLRPPAAAAKITREERTTCNARQRLLEGLRIHHLGFGFLDRHLYRARRVPGRRRRRRLLADLYSHRTDAHAHGRKQALGALCAFPPLRASPLDGLGGGLHAQRSRASLLSRVSFRPKRRHRDGRGRAHGRLLRSVLPALGDVLRNRANSAPSAFPFRPPCQVALYCSIRLLPPVAHATGCRLRAPLLSTSLPSEASPKLRPTPHRPSRAPPWDAPWATCGAPRFASASSVFVEAHRRHPPAQVAPAAPRCSSDSRRRPFWWWPSELFLSEGFDILHICPGVFPALTVNCSATVVVPAARGVSHVRLRGW